MFSSRLQTRHAGHVELCANLEERPFKGRVEWASLLKLRASARLYDKFEPSSPGRPGRGSVRECQPRPEATKNLIVAPRQSELSEHPFRSAWS